MKFLSKLFDYKPRCNEVHFYWTYGWHCEKLKGHGGNHCCKVDGINYTWKQEA